MNPKFTKKRNEINILNKILEDLNDMDIDPDVSPLNYRLSDNIEHNIKRVKDLINGIL